MEGDGGVSEAVSSALPVVGVREARIKLQFGKPEGAFAEASRGPCFRPSLHSASLP